MPKYIPASELAEQLGCTVKTIQRACQKLGIRREPGHIGGYLITPAKAKKIKEMRTYQRIKPEET